MQYIANAPAPDIFKYATGISLVQACMTRRCWLHTGSAAIYPNSAIILVGRSGIGKGPAIHPAEHLMRRLDTKGNILQQAEGIHLGPGDATMAGLVDEFADPKSLKQFKWNGQIHDFNAVIIMAEELAAFFHSMDLQTMGYLCKFLDCKSHSQRLRSRGEVDIENPVLHILGGVQPKILSQIFPGQAFDVGLNTRTLFVFSDEERKISPFSRPPKLAELEEDLLHDLRRVAKLTGPFKMTGDAVEFVEDWWMRRSDHDKPKHPKLEAYAPKRLLHLFRLAMAFNAAKSDDMIVDLDDCNKSLDFLLTIEARAPDMFETITGDQSHEAVFAEIAHQIANEFTTTGKPVPYHIVSRWVARKVKTYEIESVISGLISQRLVEVVESLVKLPGGGPKGFIPGPTLRKEQ